MSGGPQRARFALRRREGRLVDAQQALWVLVGVVAALGGSALLAALVTAATDPRPLGAALILVTASTLLTDATALEIRHGRNIESYTWGELNVVLGLVLLPPEHLVLTSLAVAVAYTADGRSPIKIVYNTSSYAVGLVLATATVAAVFPPDRDDVLRSAAALVAGAAAFSAWNKLSVDAAIALSQGLRLREVVRRACGLSLFVFLSNVTLALACLALARRDPALLLVAPGFVIVTAVLNRRYLRGVQERQVWRHLESNALQPATLEEAELAEQALVQAATLLEADEVELRVRQGAGGDTVYRSAPSGARSVTSESSRPCDGMSVITLRTSRPGTPAESRTTASVPLAGRAGPVGELAVHFDADLTLSRRERRVLLTYAGMIAASLENARLHSEVRAVAERHERASLHDDLTGLPNRTLLRSRAEQALAAPDAQVALLLIDLDGFKAVNDTHGHEAGDRLLCVVAERMRGAVRSDDVVARLGGDEFAVLLSDAASATGTADRLGEVLASPVGVGSAVVRIGGSIGTARSPVDARDYDGLLRVADAAMYEVKAGRRPAATPPEGAPRVITLVQG